MAPRNLILQSIATDLLQVLVSRGEIDISGLQALEAAVVGKLYFCVHAKRHELQNKLLHLLHSIISASTVAHHIRSRGFSNALAAGLPAGQGSLQDATQHTYSVSSLLIQTLVDGVSTPSNRATLQHWLDFVLMTIPQFQQSMQAVLAPLSECIGRQLRLLMADLEKAAENDPKAVEDVHSTTSDAEILMLLNALERLIMLNLQTSDQENTEDEGVPAEKPGGVDGGSGILGMVTNVFSSDTALSRPEEQLTVRL
jgi:hypothetical protein